MFVCFCSNRIIETFELPIGKNNWDVENFRNEQVRKGMCCKVWIILSSTIGHGDRLIWQDINRTIVLKCTPDLLDVKVQYL